MISDRKLNNEFTKTSRGAKIASKYTTQLTYKIGHRKQAVYSLSMTQKVFSFLQIIFSTFYVANFDSHTRS